MKVFESEDFKLPLTADGLYCLSGEPRRTYLHWWLAKREFGMWHSPFFALFWSFCVSMYQNFFNTIYSLIACSGVCSFYFIHKKLTQFCMYIATPLNKGSMLHQINRWGCRQSSCWLHVGFRMAANSSTSICLKFGNMVVIVTLAHRAELVLQELR